MDRLLTNWVFGQVEVGCARRQAMGCGDRYGVLGWIVHFALLAS